ncbi:MAG TPA: response regulator transcription factor [Anaerolineales bacterium]|nr:response regulator transcription factor [Anaerolineales bacterium]
MRKTNVLVVDDEKSLRDFVRHNLAGRGYKIFTAGDGLEALAIFHRENIDLVIMDVMMPDMNGLETIRRIRETSRIPIIVLSALGEEQDKIRALNLGADDYLTKPFGVGELLARVEAVQRRARWSDNHHLPQEPSHLTQGDIHVNLDRHRVEVRGKPVDLTPTEFNLLVFLMKNAGRLLTHEAILKNIWGTEYGRETEYLRVYIGRLRQKIEADPVNPQYLKTAHGFGYFFEAS